MALPVFKTGGVEHLGSAGSIPVRLRHMVCVDRRRWPVDDAGVRGSRSTPAIPRTDVLLADPLLAPALSELGRPTVKAAVTAAQNLARAGLLEPVGAGP